MHHVNKQLPLFFDQVGINTYPKKFVFGLITSFFIFVIHFDIVRIIGQYVHIPKIYYYASAWMNDLIYQTIYLMVTGAFYLLADFGFETRKNKYRHSENQNNNNKDIS